LAGLFLQTFIISLKKEIVTKIMKLKYLFFASIFLCYQIPAFAENLNDIKVYPVNQKMEIRAGDSGILTIKLEIPDKLYIYGNPKGPGVGRPTTIDINHSDNFIFEAARFAPPKKYTPKGESDYVWIYEKETKIDIPFTLKKDTKHGEYKINILVKVLVCSDRACTPHDFTFKYPIIVLSEMGSLIGKKIDDKFLQSKDIVIKNNLELNGNTKNSEILSQEISSIKPIFISNVDISNIIEAIFFGLIAGFILNFTPCVLPVISLKILDIVKYAGKDRKEIRKLGLIFAMGIITSFAVLAFFASFLEYSWGSLFQNSLFLIIMLAIVFVLSLSMFEVFTLNIPGFAGKASQESSDKYMHAYSKGFLATLLATPCSGPFLGGTLAWASTQPYYVIFIVFMSIGLGMSLPYIILTANPGLMKFIPKPGDWMITFETVIAFLLLGTCVYLIGILEQRLIMPTLWFLLFTGIAFWQYGKFGSIIKPKKNRIISRIAAILIIIAGYYLSYNYFYKNEVKFEVLESEKKNFSLSLLFENKEKGKVSIIDFTADWCPNCKLVEKTSLFTEKVSKSITHNNIDFLTADMTRENPDASALLTKLGSRSIPFLAVFPAGKSFFKPICLRDIYSEKDVLKAIEMAK
jgi:thiol:disulfide interchange protein